MNRRAIIRHTAPAATAIAAQITPSPLHWYRVTYVQVTMTAAAGGSNRCLSLRWNDGPDTLAFAGCKSAGLAGGSTGTFQWAEGATNNMLIAATPSTVINNIMPTGLVFPPGSTMSLLFSPITAGDSLSDLIVHVEFIDAE